MHLYFGVELRLVHGDVRVHGARGDHDAVRDLDALFREEALTRTRLEYSGLNQKESTYIPRMRKHWNKRTRCFFVGHGRR